MKRTKIVATIGPASESVPTLVSMLNAGMDVCRLNFSHGSHEEHLGRLKAIRAASTKAKKTIAILQDLGGPKIRIGDFDTDTVELIPGKQFIITTDEIIGNEKRVSVTYNELPGYVKKDSRILLNDGKNELRVVKVSGHDIVTEVVVGGVIKGRRGVNVPGAYLPIKSLTPKDRKDVAFGAKHDVDFVGMSFVRTAGDIKELRSLLTKHKSRAKIIAKIETQEAIENLDAIIAETDGVMVARGDLAVEIPAADVPLAQKRIVSTCTRLGKPVIVATHMLESMTTSPTPTRAEVSDVANAVLDGTDAVMLSAESALGKYPIDAVKTMASIVDATEVSGLYRGAHVSQDSATSTDTVTEAIMHAAQRGHVSYVVALTESGSTARMLARFRLTQELLVFTPHEHVQRQLALSYGCRPVLYKSFTSLETVMNGIRKHLLTSKIAKRGDSIIIAAGIPFGTTGSTNMLVLETL